MPSNDFIASTAAENEEHNMLFGKHTHERQFLKALIFLFALYSFSALYLTHVMMLSDTSFLSYNQAT